VFCTHDYFLAGFAGAGAGAGAGVGAGGGVMAGCAGCGAGCCFFSQPTKATVTTNTKVNMIAEYFLKNVHLPSECNKIISQNRQCSLSHVGEREQRQRFMLSEGTVTVSG
jgi:hypothetical protein